MWFEDGLAYDNARLPQALIVTGISTGATAYVEAGLRSLRWLMTVQTAPDGLFQADRHGELRRQADAAAGIRSAAAWKRRRRSQPALRPGARMAMLKWQTDAARAFAWFLGGNDLSMPLVDLETGSCRDGLHPDRPNENRGGESVVSYLLGLAEIRQLARISGDRAKLPRRFAPCALEFI